LKQGLLADPCNGVVLQLRLRGTISRQLDASEFFFFRKTGAVLHKNHIFFPKPM
jgi:hypothetical protein